MPNLGPTELIVILVIALLVFGPKRLPDLGRSVGRGLREFKKARDEVTGSIDFDTSDLDPNTPLPSSASPTAVAAQSTPASEDEAPAGSSVATAAAESADAESAAHEAGGDPGATAEAGSANEVEDVADDVVENVADDVVESPTSAPGAESAREPVIAPDAETSGDGEDEVLQGEVVDELQPQSGELLDATAEQRDADPA